MFQSNTEPRLNKPIEGQVNPDFQEFERVDDVQSYVIDPVEEKRVVTKLDCAIMPLMALVYFFQC